MKKTFTLIMTGFMMLFAVSCVKQAQETDIVATMFTHYDLAKHIAGDQLTVSMLVPLGQDIHSFEASSMDMIRIEHAKLFLYTSDEIDTWISDPSQIGGEDTLVVNMSYAINHNQEVPRLTADHDHTDDIHYWVDPLAALDMIDYILSFIVQIDPTHQAYYETNATAYYEEILSVHEDIQLYFSDPPHQNQTIYFAGHNAMSSFGQRYGLTISALFSEFKPDDDLTSNEIITFSNEIKNANVHYLFIEALEVPRAANAIKEALANENYSLTLLELHAYHNVSQADWDDGITYANLLSRNFDYIKLALGVQS